MPDPPSPDPTPVSGTTRPTLERFPWVARVCRRSSIEFASRGSTSPTRWRPKARSSRRNCPFVVGVLGDFSGKPTEPLKPLKDRKFIQIDRDNFNDVMARMTPGAEPAGEEHAQGRRQRAGRPAQVRNDGRLRARARSSQQVEPLKKLLETRDKLRDLLTKVDRSEDLEKVLEQVLSEHRTTQEARWRGRGRRGQIVTPAGGLNATFLTLITP